MAKRTPLKKSRPEPKPAAVLDPQHEASLDRLTAFDTMLSPFWSARSTYPDTRFQRSQFGL